MVSRLGLRSFEFQARNASSLRFTSLVWFAVVANHLGQGLILVKRRKDVGKWMLRLSVAGKRREMGLGRWPDVPLAEAYSAARNGLGFDLNSSVGLSVDVQPNW